MIKEIDSNYKLRSDKLTLNKKINEIRFWEQKWDPGNPSQTAN